MIRKLDLLIVKSFIGPFIATFVITAFVLVMQFFWLYLDDLVGKGLDFYTVFRLIGYVAATVVPLALPLAVLLSSIMTFGNLGESFELVAIKSAGIPLVRFMLPLFVVTLFICGIAFFFNNNVIPVANLKMNTLKYDIIVSKPAFDLKEGVFYDKISGYVIKIGKKDKDDRTIHDVIVYEKNYGLQDNIITAKSGVMRLSDDKRFLEFILKDGVRYQEKGNRSTANTEFIRLGFKEFHKSFDLGTLGKINKTSDSVFRDNYKMLSIRQLNKNIDSLNKLTRYYLKRSSTELVPYLRFARVMDSGWVDMNTQLPDSIKSADQLIPDSARSQILDRAITQAGSVKGASEITYFDYVGKRKDRRMHLIEWHRKFSLSVACLVLFMIGAPLGSIIRRGGLGLPVVAALIFFIFFHLMNTFGEKFVKEGVMTPLAGMWLASFALAPLGVFLTWKASRDSQLFNKDAYMTAVRAIGQFFRRPFSGRKKEPVAAKES